MRLLIIPEGTDFQTWTCTFDHVSFDTAFSPKGERPDLKAPPLPPAPVEAQRLGGSEAWRLGGLVARGLGGLGAWGLGGFGVSVWGLRSSKACRLGASMDILGTHGMLLAAPWEFLGSSWATLGSSRGRIGAPGCSLDAPWELCCVP
jgi:hypothetical protein